MMPLLFTALLMLAGVTAAFVSHVIKERRRTDEAAEIVRRMADGDPAARLECSGEGSRARLYHEINSLASVLGDSGAQCHSLSFWAVYCPQDCQYN